MAFAEPVNMTNLVDVFTYANSVSDNYYGIGVLISLYLIIFIYMNSRGEDAPNALVVAGFITSISGVFMFLMSLINSYQLFITFCTLIVPLLWAYYDKD